MRVCNYSKSSLQNKRPNQRTRLLLRLPCKTKNEKTPQKYLISNAIPVQISCRYRYLNQGFGFVPVFIWHGSGSSILGWIPIRIQIQTTTYLSLGLHKGRPNLLKKPSALKSQKRTSSTSKHIISLFFSTFCGSFLPSWIRIPNTDPDPLT